MTLLNVLGASVTVVVFIGAAAIFLKGSVYKGAIAALEATVSALETQVSTQAAQIKGLTEEGIRNRAEIESLKRENSNLLSYRPSAEVLLALSECMDTHHTETMKLLRSISA